MTIAANTILTPSQNLVNVNVGAVAVVVTLPSATVVTAGQPFTITKGTQAAGTSGTVTLSTVSGQTISGSVPPLDMTSQFKYIQLFSDGANWQISNSIPTLLTFTSFNNTISLDGNIYPYTDAGLNKAIQKLPVNGGEIDLGSCGGSGAITLGATVVIDRPVYLHGNVGNFNTGCEIAYTGSGVAIQVSADNVAHGSILEGFTLAQAGTGTVGIDIYNNQYDVVLRNVSLVTEVASWSVAAIRVGNSVNPVVNAKFYNVRVENAVIGFDILHAFAFDCYSCSSFQNTTNVQVGDASHLAAQVNFHGGNIETDTGTNLSVSVLNVSSLNFVGVYGETSGGNWLQVPNTATLANGIRVSQGRMAMNSTTANIFNINLAAADLVVDGLAIRGPGAGSNIVQDTNLAFASVTNIASDAAITFFTDTTKFVTSGPAIINGVATGFTTPAITVSTAFGLQNLLFATIAPTISPVSGFNTGIMDPTPNGTAYFIVTVGSGTANSTGTISLPTAIHGWKCDASNQSRADLILQTGNTTTTSVLTNFGTTFAATNWTNGDILEVTCSGR